MATCKLDIYLDGHNNRVIHLTGDIKSVDSVQLFRSYSPVDTQTPDDGKLYGATPVPSFQVFIGDPYSAENRLGSDDDDWEILGFFDEGSCVFVDRDRLPWNKRRDVYYKARIHHCNTYTDTCVTPAGRGHVWPDSSNVRALINTVDQEIELNGRAGKLLKARHWGHKCPRCSDYGTGRPIDDHCPECYGTGYKGGYYEAIPLTIIDQPPQVQQGRTQVDYVESEVLQARCVAYPVINRGDIWVGNNYNDRYMIDQCTPTSLYKGVPVVYTLSMKKLPQSDVIYTKTVEDIIEDSLVNWEAVGK